MDSIKNNKTIINYDQNKNNFTIRQDNIIVEIDCEDYSPYYLSDILDFISKARFQENKLIYKMCKTETGIKFEQEK
ncbi:hypothetical protein [Anaerorhabdus sp.]|uniref:hypothetical protein n=1 Tax=Anaerorhabdus sp. TaxID=1872524 RepID=UPI002B20B40E|nr:hypothetical protein [Anaerorhabdus sp.]MEA4874001.1 hypothetical protein [Anaerorhabdus sp.]